MKASMGDVDSTKITGSDPMTDWARIDLAEQGLSQLRISWQVEDESDFEHAFGDLLDDDGDLLAFVPYSRRKVAYMRVQSASREVELGSFRVNVSYTYRSEWPGSQVPQELQKSAEFGQGVASIQNWGTALCNATYAFGTDEAVDTVLSLPLDLGGSEASELPIEVITGIKGRKSANEAAGLPGYRFILDRLPDDGLWLSLSFELSLLPSPSAPQEVLRVSARIRDALVFQRSDRS